MIPEMADETISSTWRTKWFILRTSIEERLVYRADFAFATLVRFLPIVTQVFLWGAVYQASGPRDGKVLNGYTYGDMVAYSLLVMVGRAFSSMPGLTTGIARDIREGAIKKFLVQPIDLVGGSEQRRGFHTVNPVKLRKLSTSW